MCCLFADRSFDCCRLDLEERKENMVINKNVFFCREKEVDEELPSKSNMLV